MPRYVLDIHDGNFSRDDEGLECADFEAARMQAMTSLPEIARWAIPEDGDRQAFTVLVRDEVGQIVYTATLTFAGLRLIRDTEPPDSGKVPASPAGSHGGSLTID